MCIAATSHKKRKENKQGYWITTCAALESIRPSHFQWHGHSDFESNTPTNRYQAAISLCDVHVRSACTMKMFQFV